MIFRKKVLLEFFMQVVLRLTLYIAIGVVLGHSIAQCAIF